MSVTGTIHLPSEEPEQRDGVGWTPYRGLVPHPWDVLEPVESAPPDDDAAAASEPAHELLANGYCSICSGCCLQGFGNR